MIKALLHVGLLVADLHVSKIFYQNVLGLQPVSGRPDLPYPGEWYDLGGQQQLHLMQLPNPDAASMRPIHGGRDRHIALATDSIEQLAARLDAAQVVYTLSMSGRAALFCRDPDANTLEFAQV